MNCLGFWAARVMSLSENKHIQAQDTFSSLALLTFTFLKRDVDRQRQEFINRSLFSEVQQKLVEVPLGWLSNQVPALRQPQAASASPCRAAWGQERPPLCHSIHLAYATCEN